MAQYKIEVTGLEEFKIALMRNPEFISKELKKFIQRGLAKYKSGIQNNPWRVGNQGGGSPVNTGNLRDTHLTIVGNYEGIIYPTAKYANYVHDGTKKMAARPWLDWVKQSKDAELKKLEAEMLTNIVKNLAK